MLHQDNDKVLEAKWWVFHFHISQTCMHLKHRCPLKLCCFLTDTILPMLSLLFVLGYWAIGLYFYYTWPDMKELCLQWSHRCWCCNLWMCLTVTMSINLRKNQFWNFLVHYWIFWEIHWNHVGIPQGRFTKAHWQNWYIWEVTTRKFLYPFLNLNVFVLCLISWKITSTSAW